jgi:hypothetical protein
VFRYKGAVRAARAGMCVCVGTRGAGGVAKSPQCVLSPTLGVSESYANDIRAGRRRPHPRHSEVLAHLVGFSTG